MTPAIPGLVESQTAFPGVNFEMQAELFRPDGNDELPGILLMHDVYGVTEHMKSVGRRIAAEGYAVLIPDMYSRGDGPAPGWPPKREEIAKVGGYPDQRGGADVRAAIKWLQSQPGVRADHVGAMGFSFGARYILLAFEEDPSLAAVALYYPIIIYPAFTESRPRQPLTYVPSIACPTIAFYGDQDALLPQTHVTFFRDMLEGHGGGKEFSIYPGVGHGFFNDMLKTYDQTASDDAWGKTKVFLSRHLKEA
ncbi:MAG: dienelactone hydrolase family protein [Chloroflexi bacterium]|nr:dienelactone hydrolase family protein [Chloroflexota bacterium]